MSATPTDPTDRGTPAAAAPLLFTPSASPPVSRPASPPPRNKSAASRPPPSKRVRTGSVSSTPGPSGSNASGASEVQQGAARTLDPTRDEAWRESSQRLLNVWSQLAERYSVPLDQDDIIDLRTVKLVKDRGIMRRGKKIPIGYFGDASGDEGNDAYERDEDEGEGEEVDNAPRQEPQVRIKLEMEKSARVLPPFTKMNPDDADDLRAFLEEEERRKAIGGVDDEEDEVETRYIFVEDSEGDDGSDWVTDDANEMSIRVVTGTTDRALTPVDSEDEFAKWDPDDATPKGSGQNPRQSSHDIIDLTTPSPPSSPSFHRYRDLPSSPLTRSTRSPSSSPVRSSLRAFQPPEPEVGRPVTSHSKPSRPLHELARNIQLQTPPPSSSNGTPEIAEITPSEPHVLESPSPPPPRRRPKTPAPNTEVPPTRVPQRFASESPSPPPPRRRPKTPAPIVETPPPPVPPRRTSPRKSQQPQKREFARPLSPHRRPPGGARDATPAPMSGRVPEVVITSRPRMSVTPARTLGEPSRTHAAKPQPSLLAKTPSLKATDKGKGRATILDFDSSDDEPFPPPRRRAKSLAPVWDNESTFPEKDMAPTMSSPIRSVPSNKSKGRASMHSPRKRKRSAMSASSSSSEQPLSARATDKPRHASTRPPAKPSLRATKSHESFEEVDDDSDTELQRSTAPKNPPRARSQARSAYTTSRATAPRHTPSVADTWAMPTTPSRSRSHPPPPIQYPPPIPSLQDPQMQYGFVQAVQYLSYLFANGLPPPSHPPSYPSQASQNPSMAQPQTPKRHRRNSRRDQSSSPEAGPSSSPRFGYDTPNHRAHPYPFTFDPAWSSATEPPMSSSPAVSPPSSPAPSRSSSRVSFDLDPDDRSSVRGKSERGREREDGEDDARSFQKSGRKGKARQARSRAWADALELSGDDEEPPQRNVERGRTPGPPSRASSRRRKQER